MTSLQLITLQQMCETENPETGIEFPEHSSAFKRRFFPEAMCEHQKAFPPTEISSLMGLCNKSSEWSDLHGYVNKLCLILHEYLLGARHPKSTAISLISQTCSSDCKWFTSCIKY